MGDPVSKCVGGKDVPLSIGGVVVGRAVVAMSIFKLLCSEHSQPPFVALFIHNKYVTPNTA